jgi:hypothetical protein
MKFKCFCGNIIRDQTDNLPYKARYFADEDYEATYGDLVTFLAHLVEATAKGEQAAFRETYPNPKELDIAAFISDNIAGFQARFGRFLYECEQCGRLWLQYDRRRNLYAPYTPETEIRGVLRSQEKEDE